MRTGTLRGVLVLLLALSPAAAQELPPDRNSPPPPAPLLTREPVDEPAPGLSHGEALPLHAEPAHECGPGGLFLRGEYLLLKPRRRALDFAIIDPVDDGVPRGVIESLDLETQSGFRVGVGYRLPGEQWEAGVFYTYLHSNDNRGLTAPPGGILYANLARPGTIEEVTTALGLTRLNYDVLDAEIGRHFRVNDSLTVRLFGGLRAAWIEQRVAAIYNGRDANTAQVISEVNMDGFGLRVGAEGYWNLWRGVSLFGRGSSSLLVSDFRARLVQTNNGGATIQSDLFEKFDSVTPVTEIGVGIGWESRHLRVRAGYEITNWFNLVDVPDLVDDVHVGKTNRRLSDLSLEGLFVELGLLF